MIRGAVGAAAVFGVLATATEARAKGALSCTEARLLAPIDGAQIPANAPALVFTSFLLDNAGPVGGKRVHVRGPNGWTTKLTASADAGSWLVAPATPFPASAEMTVEYDPGCQQPAETAHFKTGPVAPLPTRTGTLTVTPEIKRRCYGCDDMVEGQIKLTPAAELVPWLELLQFEVRVDGERTHGATYGYLHPRENKLPGDVDPRDAAGNVTITAGRLRRDCHAPSPGIAEGTHHVEVQPRLAGSNAVIPAVAGDVTISCKDAVQRQPTKGSRNIAAAGPPPPSAPEPSATPAPVVSPAPAAAPSSVTPAPPPVEPKARTSSCSLGPGPRTKERSALALLAVVSLVARRRRRAR